MSSDTNTPPNNGAVMTIAQIIKSVMSFAVEADFCSGGRTRRPVHQLPGGRSHTPRPGRNGPQATANTGTNRQYHGARSCNQQHCKQTLQIYGYAFTLAQMLCDARTISPFLETRRHQSWKLPLQTSCGHSSPHHPSYLLNCKISTEPPPQARSQNRNLIV